MRHMIAMAVAAVALTSIPMVSIAPANAVPVCSSGDLRLDRDYYTEDQITDYYEDQLRSRGVQVISTEMWSNCVRAYVRTADGGQEMQFFDPGSLRRLQ